VQLVLRALISANTCGNKLSVQHTTSDFEFQPTIHRPCAVCAARTDLRKHLQKKANFSQTPAKESQLFWVRHKVSEIMF
jgi:hypothetical protein